MSGRGEEELVLDDGLIERVMQRYRLPTGEAAIDFALRTVAGLGDPKAMLELRGTGWDGDLDEMRRGTAARHD